MRISIDEAIEILGKHDDTVRARQILRGEEMKRRYSDKPEIPPLDTVLICCAISFAIFDCIWIWLA